MIFIVTAENRALFSAELAEVDRQWHAVLAERSPRKAHSESDVEIERDEAVFLVAKAAPAPEVLASVRLVPTDETHSVWEASGFCVAPEVRVRRARVGLLWELVCGVMETALLFGVERVKFAANAALLPLMLEFGWAPERSGPMLAESEEETTPVAVSITPDGLKNVRRHFGVRGPATRFCDSGLLRARLQDCTPFLTMSAPDSVRQSYPG
jgi:N-acyl-L-homoserine lactone synthetase